jgi:hypothetical protein
MTKFTLKLLIAGVVSASNKLKLGFINDIHLDLDFDAKSLDNVTT